MTLNVTTGEGAPVVVVVVVELDVVVVVLIISVANPSRLQSMIDVTK